jgi:catalase
MTITPAQAIDVVGSVFGPHPGYRALHAKGLVCTGTFTPTSDAAALSRAEHLRGGPLQATVRFSNGSGDPEQPDWIPDPRGLAIKLTLPSGGRTDIVCVSSPRFPVRTPQAFIDLIRAQGSGRLAPFRTFAFVARHPEALRNLPVLAPTLVPRESYAGITYYGLHAFKWLDAEGGERWVRYVMRPEFEAAKVSPRDAKARSADYLQHELRGRLAAGGVRFTFEVVIAEPGDKTNDPSAAWPHERRTVEVGTLELTGPDLTRERDGDILVFDPTRVIDGIELSDDPVLRFRGPAYSESVARRTEPETED